MQKLSYYFTYQKNQAIYWNSTALSKNNLNNFIDGF